MSNTLTGLIPTIYEALDIVSREMIGFIPAASLDAKASGVAKDQTIRVPVVPSVSSSTAVTAGLYAPDSGDQVIGYTDMSISKSQMVPVRWTGEEQLGILTGGLYQQIQRDRFAQAMRTLINEIEIDLAAAAYKGASRATGTAASTPFASALTEAVDVKTILDDNGCPKDNRFLVVNSAATANLLKLTGLTAVYAAGTDATLRQGVLPPVVGFRLGESAGITLHTKGTMTGMDCTAIEPVGEVNIAVDGGDTGTILAGDIVTRGNEGGSSADTNKYVVNSGGTATGVGSSGYFTLNKPGVKLATTVTDEWTIGGNYTPNVAFHKNALYLLARVPQMPIEGDAAEDVILVTDPISGLTFQIAMYKQYKQVHYEVGIAWGVKAVKPEHIAILMG